MLSSTQVIYHRMDKGEAGMMGAREYDEHEGEGARQQTDKIGRIPKEHRDEAGGRRRTINILAAQSPKEDCAELRIDSGNLS